MLGCVRYDHEGIAGAARANEAGTGITRVARAPMSRAVFVWVSVRDVNVMRSTRFVYARAWAARALEWGQRERILGLVVDGVTLVVHDGAYARALCAQYASTGCNNRVWRWCLHASFATQECPSADAFWADRV